MDGMMTRRELVGKTAALAAFGAACTLLPVGCSSSGSDSGSSEDDEEESSASGEKSFVYGTTGYGVEMDDEGMDPHSAYSGWSCVRYGVGETLFRFSDSMEPEPWLATSYEFTDDTHCTIELREGVCFSSGREMDAEAVKECLEDLVAVHDRAAGDLEIASIEADGYTLTIETSEPNPALINYLSDPYGAIVDMQAEVGEDESIGTGPYVATSISDTEVALSKNENYWNGTPALDSVVVRSITDGDTLTYALQSGEIDATYGLPYASYELFEDEDSYNIASCDTSRTFFCQMNFASEIMQDDAVREAIALGVDKEGFVETLLNGRGVAAVGPFTAEMAFGDETVTAETYDPDLACEVLEEAGWVDSDGDGVREKDGQTLSIRWLTYPGRMELPLLAEYAQSTLGEIGFDVEVNSTENHIDERADTSAWDVYASAFVTAPTGDGAYFFTTECLADSTKNYGGYENEELEELAAQLQDEFDSDARAELLTQMQQIILDDHAYLFVSHLTMGIVSRAGVSGIEPHPCDYYEITVDLDVD